MGIYRIIKTYQIKISMLSTEVAVASNEVSFKFQKSYSLHPNDFDDALQQFTL